MMQDYDLIQLSGRARLKADATWLMLKGAGYAAVFVLAICLVVVAIAAVGRSLPAQSREAPDPTPTSFMIAPAGPVQTA
jgi:hypothetical protein